MSELQDLDTLKKDYPQITEIFKMFRVPENKEIEAFFAVFETNSAFWGFQIGKKVSEFNIQVYLEKKKPSNLRYMNFDFLIEFPKTVYYQKCQTRYHLDKLRDLVINAFHEKTESCSLSAKTCEIKNYDQITPEQRENRRNPEFHKRLSDLVKKRDLAVLQNKKGLITELEIQIEGIKLSMGYIEQKSNRYKPSLRDSVTNSKPIRGGGCTPK